MSVSKKQVESGLAFDRKNVQNERITQKQIGQSKIVLMKGQQKQQMRFGKSEQVRQRLSLENTKLKISVENLSGLIIVNEDNEEKLKNELGRYRDKILKYKQRIRQKDLIIVRLLDRLERDVQFNSQSLKNLTYRFHEEEQKSFRQRFQAGDHIELSLVLKRYGSLLKSFAEKDKQNLALHYDKQQKEKTINELKAILNLFGDPTSKQSTLNAKLKQAQNLLQKQQNVTALMIDRIGDLEMPSEIRGKIQEISKQSEKLKKDFEFDRADRDIEVGLVKQKLVECELTLLRERQQRQLDEKKYKNYEEQYESACQKSKQLNTGILNLNNAIFNISSIVQSEKAKVEKGLQDMQADCGQLQKNKKDVDEISNSFKQMVQVMKQNSEEWSKLQAGYQERIDSYIMNIRRLQNRGQRLEQWRKLIQLRLLCFKESNATGTKANVEKQGQANDILEQLIEQYSKNKEENRAINSQLSICKTQIQKYQQLGVSKHQQLRLANMQQNSIRQLDIEEVKQQDKELVIQRLIQSHRFVVQLEQKIEALQRQIISLSSRVQELSSLSNQPSPLKKGIKSTGKILDRGEVYLQKCNIEGDYQVNFITANDISPEIQQLTFEQLADKYETVNNQLTYLKQKIAETVAEQQRIIQFKDRQDFKAQGSLLDEHYEDVDEDAHINISKEMDKLTAKNKALSNDIQKTKREYENRLKIQESAIDELKQRLKSGEEINANLSNIIIHLEGQLSRLQNNLDISDHDRGSQNFGMENSAKKSENPRMYESNNLATLNEEMRQKKKEFEDLFESGEYDNDSEERAAALRHLQMEIKMLQSKIEQQSIKSNIKIQGKDQREYYESLCKINAQLIRKIDKIETEKLAKDIQIQQEIKALQQNSPQPKSLENLEKHNEDLRQIISTIKANKKYDTATLKEQQKQITVLNQANEDLKESIKQKEKMLVKLRTQSIDNNTQKGNENDMKIKIMLLDYQKRIDQLESKVKDQQQNQINLNDLYETITYLSNECQSLRKARQPQAGKWDANNYEQLLISYEEIKIKVAQLMKQKENYESKMKENGQDFSLLKEDKAYAILKDKQKHIDTLTKANQDLKQQVQTLSVERNKVFEENERIGNDLKNIQEAIKKLAGDKIFNISNHQSTLNTDQNKTEKNLLGAKLGEPTQNKQQQKETDQSNRSYALLFEILSTKLYAFKQQIELTSHKSRPHFSIQSYQQLPILELILMSLVDRLHFVWSLVEERTNQYNELRDQMSIISMQCMKGAKIEEANEADYKRSQVEVVEQRYQFILAELIEYENQNKRLEKQVSRLKQQITIYKKQIEDIQLRYLVEIKSQSSDQIPYNQTFLNRILQSGANVQVLEGEKQIPEIIKLFLARIKQLEGNLENMEGEFDQKNQKLQSLIQKQKSFISEKSKLKNPDESVSSDNQNQPIKDRQNVSPKSQTNFIPKAVITPSGVIQQKSYSLNSAKVFKEIEELTKNNEELRNQNLKLKSALEHVNRVLDAFINKHGSSLEGQVKQQLLKSIQSFPLDYEQDWKRDNSGFDIEDDIILSSSFAQKLKGNAETDHQHLEYIKTTLEGSKIEQKRPTKAQQTSENKSQQKRAKQKTQKSFPKTTSTQANMKFLQENKFIVEQLVEKVNLQLSSLQDADKIKQSMSANLNEKQLQQILYLNDSAEAISRIIKILPSTLKNTKSPDSISNKPLQAQQLSIQQGEWVETEQLQSIINEVYPTKTDLCILVANSINMLMLSQTKQGILKCIQYLFSHLKLKQNEYRDQIRKRQESVSEYGRKLQKLLLSKYSEEQSQERGDLLNQSLFRKTGEFKPQYEMNKQLEERHNRSSQSGFFQQ